MDQRIKTYLGGALIIGILAVAYASVSYVSSFSKSIQPSSFRSFSASGEGKVVAVPDVAQFSFSVITEGGKDLTDSQTKNTEKMNKAIAYLKENGVDAKDVRTQYYNVNPRYQSFECRSYPVPLGAPSSEYVPSPLPRPCPPPEIVGYTVSQSVQVKVRDFTRIGDLLSGVVKNGANDVSGLSFVIDEPEKVQAEARAEAITKARAKAEEIAKVGGFRVGRLLSIEEGGGPIPYYERYAVQALGAPAAAPAPTPAIEPGSQEVRVQVTLRYEIE